MTIHVYMYITSRARQSVPDFYPSGLQFCPTNTNYTSTSMHLASRNIFPNYALTLFPPFHCFCPPLEFSQPPSISLIRPISKLAITLSAHKSQHGPRVLWTAAEQTASEKLHGNWIITVCWLHKRFLASFILSPIVDQIKNLFLVEWTTQFGEVFTPLKTTLSTTDLLILWWQTTELYS